MSSLTRKDPKRFAELYHRVTRTHDTIPDEVAVSKYLSRNKDTCEPKRFAGAQKMRARLLADLKKDENEGVVREGARFHFTDHDHFVTLDAINHTFEGTATSSPRTRSARPTRSTTSTRCPDGELPGRRPAGCG
jgi:hypothetical protein